jgi:D-alanyl-D-alanine carboxypeptidase/D-alanyl-D-alanine-endopeptidase (penicillin-binding protein 4)
MISVGCTFSAQFDSLVLSIINSSGHRSQNIGFEVRRVRDNQKIAELNSDSAMIPASLQKLFTAAAAFDKLGTIFKSETKIYAENFDKVSGEIKGNMYIVGAGDPGISAQRLWLMTQHLRHCGVKSIPNKLVIDNSYFDENAVAPGFDEEQNSRAYMSPISAFAVSFNSTGIVVQPTAEGRNAYVHLFPAREDVSFRGGVATATKGKDLSVSTQKSAANEISVILGGAIKPDEKPKYVYRQSWEPVSNAGESFRVVAKESGINAKFSVDIGKVDTTKAQLILVHESEPIYFAVGGMFKYSNNFIAEMIFLTLAAQTSNSPANWETASQIVEKWWEEKFPQGGKICVVNGSGMGNQNKCGVGQIADLLNYASKQNWFYEYVSGMPIAGIDGTLSTRFKNSDLKGNLRAKTGTLNNFGVSSLAGYFNANGELYSAVFIANDRATAQYAKWTLSDNLISGIKKAIEAKKEQK